MSAAELSAFFAGLWAALKKALPFLEGMYVQYLRDQVQALNRAALEAALNQQIWEQTSGTNDDLDTLSDSERAARVRDALAKRKPIA